MKVSALLTVGGLWVTLAGLWATLCEFDEKQRRDRLDVQQAREKAGRTWTHVFEKINRAMRGVKRSVLGWVRRRFPRKQVKGRNVIEFKALTKVYNGAKR